MENNTEKVVVIFDRIDETAITVIESLGGEIQPKEADNFKEKEVEILVPDNVKFYDWGGDITLEVSEGIFLTVDGSGDLTLTTASSGFTPIKCKLVPVKYEDVQVGDFVVPKRGLHNKSRAYSMKHGDDKFCSAYFGSFKFNDVLAYKRAKILKVVRC
jgi:hypothetical protein